MRKVSDYIMEPTPQMTLQKQQSIQEIMHHEACRQFLDKHQLDETFVSQNWLEFLNLKKSSELCAKCKGIDQCRQNVKGYERLLSYEDGELKSYLKACKYGKEIEKMNHIYSLCFTNLPKNLLAYNFIDLKDHIAYNKKQIEWLSLLKDQLNQRQTKGLYLHGASASGKTLMMGAFCHELALKNIPSALVSVPRLISSIKQSFNSDENVDLDFFMQVDYLILDDLGAESLSTWARDEIIYHLLDERAIRNLPTFFTSYFDLGQLEKHYRLKQDDMSAQRLVEKIKALTNNFI